MPTLRCLIGTSPTSLNQVPINTPPGEATYLKSDTFEGRVAVFVKFDDDYSGNGNGSGGRSPKGSKGGSREGSPTECENKNGKGKGIDAQHEYFSRPERNGVTWSIQVQGRFLKTYNADDVLFGNTFDRPLQLPWGSGAALKFMNYIDPTLSHDLTSQTKPWALSPLISTMPYFHHDKLSSNSNSNSNFSSTSSVSVKDKPFPTHESITDDTSHLLPNGGSSPGGGKSSKSRRTKYANVEKRKEVTFGPDDLITTDFCYGFLKFPSLTLALPAGLSFDLKRYWDGQPVRFVCCERPQHSSGEANTNGDTDTGVDGMADAKTFWVVQFELWEDGVGSDELGDREESLVDEEDSDGVD